MANLITYFQEQLDEKYSSFLNNSDWCKREFSEASVHDLRVSSRRLASLCYLLDNFSKNSYCFLLSRHLKKQISMFSELRDTQVQLLSTLDLGEKFPIVFPYRLYLMLKEKELINGLEGAIRKINTETSEIYIFYINHSLRFSKSREQYSIENMKSFVLELFDEVFSRYQNADSKDIDSIHKIRLAFKKFRYVLEILEPQLGLGEEELKELKMHQTMMGNIQDNNVFVSSLEEYISDQKTNSPYRFETLLQYKMEERKYLVEEFFLNFESINSFKRFLS
jgi:CHAD domain-containing protein